MSGVELRDRMGCQEQAEKDMIKVGLWSEDVWDRAQWHIGCHVLLYESLYTVFSCSPELLTSR